MGLRVRALVIAAVFDKSLTQATAARAEQTTGKLGTAGRHCPLCAPVPCLADRMFCRWQ